MQAKIEFTQLIGDEEPLVPLARILEMKGLLLAWLYIFLIKLQIDIAGTGLKKTEQQNILAAYREHTGETPTDDVSANKTTRTTSSSTTASTLSLAFSWRESKAKKDKEAADSASSTSTPTKRSNMNIRKLESLIKRFQ